METRELVWHGFDPRTAVCIGIAPDRQIWVRTPDGLSGYRWHPAKHWQTSSEVQVGGLMSLAEFAMMAVDDGIVPNVDYPSPASLAKWLLGQAPCMSIDGELCLPDDPRSWLVVLNLVPRRTSKCK